MKRLLLAIAALIVIVPTLGEVHAKTLRVSLVLPGPVTDGTFNTAAHRGIKAAEKNYDIKISIQEHVGFADSQAAMMNYARDGYDVVIGHGFQFAEPATKIHKQFPKT